MTSDLDLAAVRAQGHRIASGENAGSLHDFMAMIDAGAIDIAQPDVAKTGGLTVSAVARALSGLPFSVIDSNTDPDRNGILYDFLPAGTYTGTGRNPITVDYDGKRNGAYGPGFLQLDLRAGYRLSLGARRRLNTFVDFFNVTNRTNFATGTQPGAASGNQANPTFLVPTGYNTSYTPRKIQLGVRYEF